MHSVSFISQFLNGKEDLSSVGRIVRKVEFEKFFKMMGFQICRLVCDVGVCDAVRLVEGKIGRASCRERV